MQQSGNELVAGTVPIKCAKSTLFWRRDICNGENWTLAQGVTIQFTCHDWYTQSLSLLKCPPIVNQL